jgi:hypothetical protein
MSTGDPPLPACYRAECTNKDAYDSIDALLALNVAGKSLRELGVVHETLADRIVPDPNFLRARKSERNGKRSKYSKNKGSGTAWDDLSWELCARLRHFSREPPQHDDAAAPCVASRSTSPVPASKTASQITRSPYQKKLRGDSGTVGRRSATPGGLQERYKVWCRYEIVRSLWVLCYCLSGA